jgi:protein-L-isoaspartate(D-aspartate) O-methyltransferase
VGSAGSVTAIELDPQLAARASANLSSLSSVRVIEGDGSVMPFDPADVIYVNAGATRPADAWLDGLAEGGRLILPLTTNKGFRHNDPAVPIERRGAVFRIEHRSGEFLARWISPVATFPCESARDTISEAAPLRRSRRVGGSGSHICSGTMICWRNTAGCARRDGA